MLGKDANAKVIHEHVGKKRKRIKWNRSIRKARKKKTIQHLLILNDSKICLEKRALGNFVYHDSFGKVLGKK